MDPNFIDDLIKNFRYEKIDYMCNHIPKLNSDYPDGFGAEIFNLNVLEKINKLTIKKYLEHVTLYLHDNLKKFKVKFLTPKDHQKFPSLKFDVDTVQDFKEIESFVKAKKVNFETDYKEIIQKIL